MQHHPGCRTVGLLCGPPENEPHAQRVALFGQRSVQGRKEHSLAEVCRVLPQRPQQAQQRAAQTDARTHDFAAVRTYASPYVGNNSNTVNLFYHLPLGDVPARFEIGDDASLCVRYQAALADLDAAKARRDLVYDSAAAFALIDNLSAVCYEFSDGSYVFTRAQMEAVLGVPLSALRDGAAMHDRVQARLEDAEFVASFYAQTQPER